MNRSPRCRLFLFPMPRTAVSPALPEASLGCLTGASAHVPDPVPGLQCLNIWHTLKHTGTQSLVSCTSSRLYTTLVCLFIAFLVMLPIEVIHSAEACLHFHVVLLSQNIFLHIILACASVMLFKDGCSYFFCIAVTRDIAESCAFSPVRLLWLLIQSSCYIISTSLTRPHLLEI